MTSYNDGIPERELTLQYKTPEGFVKPVTAVDTSNDVFTVSGDQTSILESGDKIEVEGSTGNDGDYNVSSVSYDSNNNETSITVEDDVTDGTADGKVYAKIGVPDIADGTEITLFAESIKEIFQKDAMLQSIRKGPENQFRGDKTLVNDTLNAKHTFEISAWVYSNKQGKHSLDDGVIKPGTDGEEAESTTETIQADEFGRYIPLGDTGIKHDSETVTTADGTSLTRGTDYEMDYSRGEIKFLDSGNIDTATNTTTFAGQTLSTQTVINEGFNINYTFDASANNIARLVRRMSQLGGTFVMRLDKSDFTAAQGEENARGYLVLPKKIQIVSKSSKPDEYKIEMELRKGTTEQ